MTSSPHMLGAAEASSENPSCPNCGAELLGEYCHKCGQKKIHRNDFALKHFFSHVAHEFTHLDSNKILKTFSALLFKPGHLTAEYLAGKRGSFINPIRLYLTFSAIYFLFAWGVLSDVRGGGAARTATNYQIIAAAKQKGIEPITLAEKIYQKAEKYSAALRFTSVLISGVFLTVLYLRTKRYYVEHLVFSLHYYSFDFFFKSVFGLLFVLGRVFGASIPSVILNLFYPLALIYLILALRRVYRQSWLWTGMKSVVLFICETLLFIAVNIAGFMIAFALV